MHKADSRDEIQAFGTGEEVPAAPARLIRAAVTEGYKLIL